MQAAAALEEADAAAALEAAVAAAADAARQPGRDKNRRARWERTLSPRPLLPLLLMMLLVVATASGVKPKIVPRT